MTGERVWMMGGVDHHFDKLKHFVDRVTKAV